MFQKEGGIMEILVSLIAIGAGVVQGITGFGSGIVMMMILPMFFSLPQSAGISTAICMFLNISMVYTYRKSVNFKKVIIPSLCFLLICSTTIYFSTMFDQVLMKKILGIFFIVLSIYYLFINKSNDRKKLSLSVTVLFILISAICDGLFGIGGPLMVIYFLSQTHNTHEYLGIIQSFFLVNCIYNTGFRIMNGILLPEHLMLIGIGAISIMIGGMIARKVVDKLDGMVIRKLTYIMIGISGIINLIK